MKYGDKLVLKNSNDLLEVTAVFPGSQGFRIESGETFYGISIGGQIAYMPESLVNTIMVNYVPKPIEIKATVSDVIEKTVKVKKVIKKKKA